MLDSTEIMQVVMMHTLGLTILNQVFRAASYATFSANSAVTSEPQACYMWIQGTGLDSHLKRFGLEYDAEALRDTFSWVMRHRS